MEARHDKAHERIIWSAAWAPDSKHAITGSRDKTVKIWCLQVRFRSALAYTIAC